MHIHSLPNAARIELIAVVTRDMATSLITSETDLENPVAVVHDLALAGFGVTFIEHLAVPAIDAARSILRSAPLLLELSH